MIALSWLAGWVEGSASAEDVGAASQAFAQAQKEMLAGEPARAADLFELADSLAPSAVALRNAARARLAAGHNATAASHALELLRRYPEDQDARAVAERLLDRLAPTLGRVRVVCSEPCTLQVDGAPATAAERKRHAIFVNPGQREIVAIFSDGRKARAKVEAEAGNGSYRLELDAPPVTAAGQVDVSLSESRPAGHGSRKVSRMWPVATGVLALGLAGAATYFGLETLSARDEVLAANERNDPDAAQAAYDRGHNTQLATNIFIGAAGVAGVATLTLALFTDWTGNSQRQREIAIQPLHGGANVVFSGRF